MSGIRIAGVVGGEISIASDVGAKLVVVINRERCWQEFESRAMLAGIRTARGGKFESRALSVGNFYRFETRGNSSGKFLT